MAKSTEVRLLRRADLIVSEMESPEDKAILEIGCGTGELAYRIAQKTFAEVLATDICRPFIDEAKKRFQLPNVRYEVADFNQIIFFKEKTFDYIVGNGILHHLYPHLDDSLAKMKSLLKDKGKIIFFEPNYMNPYVYFIFTIPPLRSMAKLEPDEMAFSRRYIMKKLSTYGFANILVEYKDFLIPGVSEILIQPSIIAGNVLEKIPFAKNMSQSLFIRASKSDDN